MVRNKQNTPGIIKYLFWKMTAQNKTAKTVIGALYKFESEKMYMEFSAKTFNELTTKELYEILKARSQIFIMEQNIHYQDMDDIDYKALHCYIMDDNKVAAYLRAFYHNNNEHIVQIGRVLTLVHGNGLGRELMQKSIIAIKEKMKCEKLCIDAQKHAVGFYEKVGFTVSSDDFLEEGIVHQKMELFC